MRQSEGMSNPMHTKGAEVDDPDRRNETRHDAARLGPVTARLVGGSEVRLVNFSNRGILVESDARLQIGARASVRITTKDGTVVVTGRVVRSRVKGLINGVLLYDAGLNLDNELSLAPAEIVEAAAPVAADPAEDAASDGAADEWSVDGEGSGLEFGGPIYGRQTMDGEAMLQLFASVPQNLAELRRLAADNQW